MGSTRRTTTRRGLQFAANPVLAIELPAWRSRLALFVLFAGFALVLARALWLQVISHEFLQNQGAYRYARTLELPATRGRVLDRHGQVLASSLPVKAVWAIPEDVAGTPPEKLAQLGQLLGMSPHDISRKLDADRSFVYLKRQVAQHTVDAIMALGIAGIHTRK